MTELSAFDWNQCPLIIGIGVRFHRNAHRLPRAARLDDWGLTPLDPVARRDLLEILDDRYQKKSTVIAAQLPVENWHDWIAGPALDDAILDRIVHNPYGIHLNGESQRKTGGLQKPASYVISAKRHLECCDGPRTFIAFDRKAERFHRNGQWRE